MRLGSRALTLPLPSLRKGKGKCPSIMTSSYPLRLRACRNSFSLVSSRLRDLKKQHMRFTGAERLTLNSSPQQNCTRFASTGKKSGIEKLAVYSLENSSDGLSRNSSAASNMMATLPIVHPLEKRAVQAHDPEKELAPSGPVFQTAYYVPQGYKSDDNLHAVLSQITFNKQSASALRPHLMDEAASC